MVKYELVPTKEIRKLARAKGEKPRDYIMNNAYSMPKNAGKDARKMDKRGIGYIEDIMITRSDGSKVIIHPVYSDIDGLQKIELSEVDERNKIVSTKLAYTEGLNFEKMQSDRNYLECLGDLLLSRKRLINKEQMAQKRGIEDIYIGTVGKEDGEYVKMISKPENEMLKDIYDAKREHKKTVEKAEKQKKIRANKQKMILAINSKLQTLSSEELSQICEAIGVSLDDMDLEV